MLFRRGVNLCGIEQFAWTTTASTGDVPPGIPYEFKWITSSDGLYKYSNCSYTSKSLATIPAEMTSCGTLCATTQNCDISLGGEGGVQ